METDHLLGHLNSERTRLARAVAESRQTNGPPPTAAELERHRHLATIQDDLPGELKASLLQRFAGYSGRPFPLASPRTVEWNLEAKARWLLRWARRNWPQRRAARVTPWPARACNRCEHEGETMSLLGRIFGRNRAMDAASAEDVPEDAVDPTATDGARPRRKNEEGAYAPEAARARLLAQRRLAAEADAVRHAEDMLDRQFPIAEEAEAIAEARLASLQVEFIARDGELGERQAICEREIAAAANRLAALGAALRAEGVPPDQVGMHPLRPRRFAAWKIAAGLTVGLGLGYLLASSEIGAVGIAAALAAALLLAIWLYATGPEDLEERTVVALRESYAAVDEVLLELNSEVARIEIEREALRGETRAIAENEVAFAGQLAAAYASAAFSAMPAGSLEGGREFAQQREPSVLLPGWVQELETVA